MIEKAVNKHDKRVDRILEFIPGFLTWAFMLSPVWLGILYPNAVIFLLSFLTVYWSYMAFKQTAGLMIGYPKYQKEMAEDWWKKCQEIDFSKLPDKETLPDSLADVKHFLVIPMVDEPEEVLRPEIDAFCNQTFPTKQVTLVYSIEERFAEEKRKEILEIFGDRINNFHKVLIYAHPAGIPGEAIGSGGGNRTWGGRHGVAKLKEDGESIKNYIFTNLDADHVFDNQFLARLTHLYLLTDRRNNNFYTTAVHLYNNNHWNVHPMMRIESNFVTMGALASRSFTSKAGRLLAGTFACFSTSLQTLIDVDYWDVYSGVDDTTFFWRAYFKRNGDFGSETHYIPYSADAVEGETFWKAHRNLYKQLLRWGWGVVEVPISMKGLLTNKKIPLSKKLVWAYGHLKKRVFLTNVVFLLTFGFGIMSFVNPNIKQSAFAYNLPDIMSVILTFTLFFLLPAAYYRAKLTPDMPKEWPWYKKAFTVTESFIVIINLLTFSFFPFIEAQTRMMVGNKMKDHYHTPKMRKNPL